ncbi:LOW QUALITY PROTEIN: trace amine-associated receptor 2-like [Pantherophis guttatus]|uniref:LOW QUALITY PROTEIN: trace amine-associated receptor 2-like n=1 Tax=Pantherophis guttatus TaxID=94885 RepID=A0A6P9B440_PANGU|nr:LOW QUALITY PROTEIN: trace amine-associated receptor 2-like [Pantherophis guttatus]
MVFLNASKHVIDCSEFGNESCPENPWPAGMQGAMYISLSGIIIITVFGNMAIIISITYFRQLHSPTNFLILSMAITDFLLGFFIMPYSMVRSVERCWHFGMTFCKIHYSFDLMLCLVSIFHLCSIAVDRFYAICHPLHYSHKITVPRIMQLIIVCWSVPSSFAFGLGFSEAYASGIDIYEILVACSSSCPIIFNKLWGTVLFSFGFFIPASVITGIYIKIFAVSKKHLRVMKSSGNKNSNQLSKSTDRKAAKTLSIVIGVYFFCWFPCLITILIDPFLDFSTPAVLFDGLNWLGYFNSSCNPSIYGFFYPWFRKALRYILSGKIFQQHFSTANLFPGNK